MTNEKFDRLLSTIRNEHVDENVVSEARERAWKSVTANPATVEGSAHTIRGCEDFQALIPSYLGKKLAPARVLLFEDHVHSCVECRHALQSARSGRTQIVRRLEKKPAGSVVWRWAMGTTAAAVVAVGVFAFANGLLPGQNPVRAAVERVDGSLYEGSGVELRLIPDRLPDQESGRGPHGKGVDCGGAAAGRISGGDGRAVGCFGVAGMEGHDDSSGWRAGHCSGREAAHRAPLCGDRRWTGFGKGHDLFGEPWNEGIARGRDRRRGSGRFRRQHDRPAAREKKRLPAPACLGFRSKTRLRGARIPQNIWRCWETSRFCRSSLRRSRDRGCVIARSCCLTFPITRWCMRRFQILPTH